MTLRTESATRRVLIGLAVVLCVAVIAWLFSVRSDNRGPAIAAGLALVAFSIWQLRTSTRVVISVGPESVDVTTTSGDTHSVRFDHMVLVESAQRGLIFNVWQVPDPPSESLDTNLPHHVILEQLKVMGASKLGVPALPTPRQNRTAIGVIGVALRDHNVPTLLHPSWISKINKYANSLTAT